MEGAGIREVPNQSLPEEANHTPLPNGAVIGELIERAKGEPCGCTAMVWSGLGATTGQQGQLSREQGVEWRRVTTSWKLLALPHLLWL